MSPSPSLTAIERGNPPPRRKSCSACIKAKRRCDLGSPACLRCSQRNLQCRYAPNVTAGQRRPQSSSTAGAAPSQRDDVASPLPTCLSAAGDATPDAVPETPSWNLDLSLGLDADPSCSLSPLLNLDPMGPSFEPGLDVLDAMPDLPQTGGGGGGQNWPFQASDASERWPTIINAASPYALITQPKWDNQAELAEMLIDTRLRYSIDEIVRAPKRMVLENMTPWSHPHLYTESMPRSMQDAHAACALYLAKNDVNRSIILRSIENRVQELVNSPMPSSPFELLARTQSLLLYQIIRLFDGDIRARAAAEATVPALEEAATELLQHIKFENPIEPPAAGLDLFPVQMMKEFWRTWMFQESARRSFLAVFFLMQTYRLLTGDVPLMCDKKLYLCHSWTLSAHLWHAGDAFAFMSAWRGKKYFIVRNDNIMETLMEAKADDVDLFGKMLLTALLGIDEAKGWLMLRGGSL